MDVKAFLDTWRTSTIALQDSEKGRLIDALAVSFQNVSSENNSSSKLCGREKTVFPFLKEMIESKTTNERAV